MQKTKQPTGTGPRRSLSSNHFQQPSTVIIPTPVDTPSPQPPPPIWVDVVRSLPSATTPPKDYASPVATPVTPATPPTAANTSEKLTPANTPAWMSAPIVEDKTPAWMSAPLVDDTTGHTLVPVEGNPFDPSDKNSHLSNVSQYAQFLKGVGKGLRDPIDGLSQLVTHVLPSGVVNAGNRFNNWLVDQGAPLARLDENTGAKAQDKLISDNATAYNASRDASGSSGFDWGRLAGNVANPVNLAVPGGSASTVGSALARGVAGGAAIAAAQPVEDNNANYWASKGSQAAWGAGTGGLLGTALHGGQKLVSDAARQLAKAGVRLTPGQLLGGFTQRLEDSLTSWPLLGDAIKSAQNRSLKDFSNTAVNRSLQQIGQKLPKGVSGHDAIAYAGEKLSGAYDDLLPKLTVRLDEPFLQDMSTLSELSDLMHPSQSDQFQRLLGRHIYSQFSEAGHMTPQAMKAADSELGRLATAYAKDPGVDARELSTALREAQATLRRLVERNNPEFAGELSAINRGWANFVRVQRAASYAGAKDGVFTPSQLHTAVRATDASRNKAMFARGDALMQDLSSAGRDVLSNTVRDTGDATRLGIGALMFGGGGVLSPHIPAAALTGTAAYALPQAQSAIRAAILSAPTAATVLQNLRAPQAAAAVVGNAKSK